MSTTRRVMRGEIYYVRSYPTVGHEQRSGRPAVIVSNDENNAHSRTYEICFLTLQEKTKLPTHVFIDRGPCINSTILCEQITTISEERLGDFMCRIPEELEKSLDIAMTISLGLTSKSEDIISTHHTSSDVLNEFNAIKHECASLRNKLDVTQNENITLKENLVSARSVLESANLKAEMYERMYNDLLDRLMKRGQA